MIKNALLILALALYCSGAAAVISLEGGGPHVTSLEPEDYPLGAQTVVTDSVDVITDGTLSSTDDSVTGALDITGYLTSYNLPAGEYFKVNVELIGGATFTADPVIGDFWDGDSSESLSLFGTAIGASSAEFRGNTGDGLSTSNVMAIDVRGIGMAVPGSVDIEVTVTWIQHFGNEVVRQVRVPYLRWAGAPNIGSADSESGPFINLDTASTLLVYASEQAVTDGSQISDSEDGFVDQTLNSKSDTARGMMDLTGSLGVDIPASATLIFEIDLSGGATFSASPRMGDIWDGDSSQPAVMKRGGFLRNYAVFNVATGDGFASSEQFTLDIRGLTVTGASDITLSIAMKLDDGTTTETVRELMVDYITFASTLRAEFNENAMADAIDLSQNSAFFDGGANDPDTELGNVEVGTWGYLSIDGSWVYEMSDILSSLNIQLEATSSLDVFEQLNASISVGSASATVSGATADVQVALPGENEFDVVFQVPADNESTIERATVTANVTGVAKSGFSAAEFSDTGIVGRLFPSDEDLDGIANRDDNCPQSSNADQADADADGVGDLCDTDIDGDGIANADDNCPRSSNSDQTLSQIDESRGDVCDLDTDLDGVFDGDDLFPTDAAEWSDLDGDGIGDNADTDADLSARAYLMTSTLSPNVTQLHLINDAAVAQQFRGTLYNRDGVQLGEANLLLHEGVIESRARLVLTSADLEVLFAVNPWEGPAMLEVTGTSNFNLMTKLTSPSGLISNTNCVVEDRVHNLEGFDSSARSYIRLINTGADSTQPITANLIDSAGSALGSSNVTLSEGLAPKQAVWLTRDELSSLFDATWDGAASLVIATGDEDLKLLNLNLVNNETYFNFSCFESSDSGRVYLMTSSASVNVTEAHIINTSDSAQDFSGRLFSRDGDRLGTANVFLTSGPVEAGGRLVLTAEDLEALFGVGPWAGPALLEVLGSGSFELMTKLTSVSGLISNTNCVRTGNVQNIEGRDSEGVSYIRLINDSLEPMQAIRATLTDSEGKIIGNEWTEILSLLNPNQAVFISRYEMERLFDSWQGEAQLEIQADHLPDLKLINLNHANRETFFNFSCYESAE